MSLFSHDHLAGRLAAAWSRRRAITRLIEQLDGGGDRRLADIGVARRDIARVAQAAYPSADVAAADFRSRMPLAFAGAHG